MTRAQISMYVWTLHLSLAGVVLLLTPSHWFTWVGLHDPGQSMWLRLSGMLMAIMGFYFFQAARYDNRQFMEWGVTARMIPIVFLSAFVALELENPVILAFGLLDVVTGLWTTWALRRDQQDNVAQGVPSATPSSTPLARSWSLRSVAFAAALSLTTLGTNASAHAETLEEIVHKASNAQESLGNAIVTAKLSVAPKTGTVREHTIDLRVRRNGQALHSSMLVTAPASLAGMQFLRNQLSATADEMQLYVPATKQVQVVPPAARQKKFLNSDFAIGDLQLRPSDLVQPKIVEETSEHWVIAAKPATVQPIEWILFTISKTDFATSRACFYHPGHKMVKDMQVKKWNLVDNIRVPATLEMKDLLTGSTSTFEIQSQRLHVTDDELPLSSFTRR